MDTIVIDGPDARDTSRKADAQPGIMANGKIAWGSKMAPLCKHAMNFDNRAMKDGRKKTLSNVPEKESNGDSSESEDIGIPCGNFRRRKSKR